MTEQKVSLRYARALIETAAAIDNNAVERVFEDFNKINAAFIGSREFRSITKSPVVQQWRKAKIYEEMFSNIISQLSMKFLLLLIDKRRGNLIPDIVIQFIKLYYQMKGVVQVIITSAVDLNSELKNSIQKKIESNTGFKIIPEWRIEPAIKGGIKVRIEDWVYDASLKNQLDSLYHDLTEGNK